MSSRTPSRVSSSASTRDILQSFFDVSGSDSLETNLPGLAGCEHGVVSTRRQQSMGAHLVRCKSSDIDGILYCFNLHDNYTAE